MVNQDRNALEELDNIEKRVENIEIKIKRENLIEDLNTRESIILKRILNEIKQNKLDTIDSGIKLFMNFRDKNDSLYKLSEEKFKKIENKSNEIIDKSINYYNLIIYILILNSITLIISIFSIIVKTNKKSKK